jgi:hypothetical protein
MYCLKGGQHAISAIKLTATRLAIDVRPNQQRRELRLTTLERQEEVSRRRLPTV